MALCGWVVGHAEAASGTRNSAKIAWSSHRCAPAQPLRAIVSPSRRFAGRFATPEEHLREWRKDVPEPVPDRLGFADVELRRVERGLAALLLGLERVIAAHGHPGGSEIMQRGRACGGALVKLGMRDACGLQPPAQEPSM